MICITQKNIFCSKLPLFSNPVTYLKIHYIVIHDFQAYRAHGHIYIANIYSYNNIVLLLQLHNSASAEQAYVTVLL